MDGLTIPLHADMQTPSTGLRRIARNISDNAIELIAIGVDHEVDRDVIRELEIALPARQQIVANVRNQLCQGDLLRLKVRLFFADVTQGFCAQRHSTLDLRYDPRRNAFHGGALAVFEPVRDEQRRGQGAAQIVVHSRDSRTECRQMRLLAQYRPDVVLQRRQLAFRDTDFIRSFRRMRCAARVYRILAKADKSVKRRISRTMNHYSEK